MGNAVASPTVNTAYAESHLHEATYKTKEELDAGLETLLRSPKDEGLLHLIVRRPDTDLREVLQEAQLDVAEGLVGDNWQYLGSSRMADRSPHPDMQLNIMNSRVAELVAGDKDRWQLAGDQLFIDIDLTDENLPPGTRLALGSAVIEVTDQPHNGCKKYAARFGKEALKFIESPLGKAQHMRGICAKVVQPGAIRVGDVATKIK